MKAYLVNFSANYIGGDMLIVAETKRKAFNLAKKTLIEEGFYERNTDMTIDDLNEVELTKPSTTISNGDY